MSYNGWANYETWLIALHLNNDAGPYERLKDRAQELLDALPNDERVTRKDDAVQDLADEIKAQHYEEAEDEHITGVLADLINSALQEVRLVRGGEGLLRRLMFTGKRATGYKCAHF